MRSRANPLNLAHVSAVVLDVDGTLIDSNGAHAESWAAALTEHGYPSDAAEIRSLIGMGADELLPRVAGIEEQSSQGLVISKRKKELFAQRLPQLQSTPGARALLSYLKERQKIVVVATSADETEMHALLAQAGVDDLIPHLTSKDEVSQSKPNPDIVRAAIVRAGSQLAGTVMVGDTPYDIEAARRAGIDTIALRSGGYWSDLALGGAIAILDNPADLLSHWQSRPPMSSH